MVSPTHPANQPRTCQRLTLENPAAAAEVLTAPPKNPKTQSIAAVPVNARSYYLCVYCKQSRCHDRGRKNTAGRIHGCTAPCSRTGLGRGADGSVVRCSQPDSDCRPHNPYVHLRRSRGFSPQAGSQSADQMPWPPGQNSAQTFALPATWPRKLPFMGVPYQHRAVRDTGFRRTLQATAAPHLTSRRWPRGRTPRRRRPWFRRRLGVVS